MKKIKLYLEPADSLNDLFIYLSELKKGMEVFLVLRTKPAWLDVQIDRHLFEKYIHKSGIKVFFVAADRKILSQLKRAGLKGVLPLAKLPKSVGALKRSISQNMPISGFAFKRTADVHQEIEPVKKRLSAKSPKKFSWPIVGFSVLILLIVAGSLFLSLPKAKIILTLPATPLQINVQLALADQSRLGQAPQGAMPGRYLEQTVQASQEFQATGRKDIGEKARGQVTIFNGSGKRIGLVVGTLLENESGQLFKLTRDVVIDGAVVSEEGELVRGHATAQVIAAESGAVSNVGATRLFFPDLGPANRELIFAESELISGGAEEVIEVVSSEDIENASDVLLEKLKSEAIVNFSGELQAGEALLPGLVAGEAISINSNVNVGGQAKSFKLSIRAKVWTIVPSDEDIGKFIDSVVTDKIKAGEKLVGDPKETLRYQILDTKDLGVIVGNVLLEGKSAPIINESSLKQGLIGQSQAQASEYLAGLEHVVTSQIELWPFWVKKTPSNIRFDYLYFRP